MQDPGFRVAGEDVDAVLVDGRDVERRPAAALRTSVTVAVA